MSHRLLNRSGVSSSSNTNTELPEYEPLVHPLTDAARRELSDLSNTRATAVYQQQLNESLRIFGFSVGDLHERLRTQRDALANQRARREEKGTEKPADEERLEVHIVEFEDRVNALTELSEKAVRDLIDRRAELEDEAAIFSEVHDIATAEAQQQRQQRAQEAEDGNDEEEEEPTVSSVVGNFKDLRAKKESEYTSLTARERYALDNDYAAFKKLWHDAMAGEEGPPLPDASRWFTSDGQPVMNGAASSRLGGGDDDEDDDIAVARESISINCPLTLQPMKDPYTNRNCKHTFEKAALLEYLPMRGEHQCPQAGCSQSFSRARFDHDFYQDQATVRRIKRVRQAQEQREMDEDEDDGNSDDEMRVRGHQTVLSRVPKRERADG
ncbi:hypothetical protein F66182_6275 [Fusarium sp. NRRL 66182]|nr:hypothetical protein F66182_6275 [Fusarium sp. NRRL 66182]